VVSKLADPDTIANDDHARRDADAASGQHRCPGFQDPDRRT